MPTVYPALLWVALLATIPTGCDSSVKSFPTANSTPVAEENAVLSHAETGGSASEWRRVTPEEKTTPLIASLLDRDKERFEQLLDDGADPNEWDQYGRNAVTVAAGIPNSQSWLRFVLFHGGDPHSRSPESIKAVPLLGGGFAPIHMAAALPSNELNVRILVEAGVDVNVMNAYQMTPLGLAIDSGSYEVAAFLVHNGGDVDAKGTGGFTIRERVGWIGTDDDALFLSPEDAFSLARLRESIAKSDAAEKVNESTE